MNGFETALLIEGAGKICQDRVAIIDLGDSLVAALADGSGGSSGGTEAAEIFIANVRDAFSGGRPPIDHIRLSSTLAEIDREIYGNKPAGETTAVIAHVMPRRIIGASVGDSGAWLINESGIDDLTCNQKRKPLLGSGIAMPISFESPFKGTLLIASDGLFKYADPQKISQVIRRNEPRIAAPLLIDLVRLGNRELQDDVSLIIARPPEN